VDATGDVTDPEPLPCWYDDLVRRYNAAKKQAEENEKEKDFALEGEIEPAELFMTLVVPAYNEEHRLTGMLEEAVNYLENAYGTTNAAAGDVIEIAEEKGSPSDAKNATATPRRRKANGASKSSTSKSTSSTSKPSIPPSAAKGWEILLIDDGSTDDTILTAQTFSRVHILPKHPRRASGPWTHRSETAVKIPPGSIRMVSLSPNRGKGGAVTHGMRHARGQYVVFADADGASDIADLGKLVSACQEAEDEGGRGVAVGSRAHLVGSDAVVKRSKLRNFLMHSFHLLLKLMTPPATARVRDTQCGFKLFSRPTLPHIIPHMHMDGWIFDVEMLMLAEFAGIPVVEVPVGWREVVGSKLNVVKDSIGMAWGLALLRLCWGVGIYRR
jgi:dolichyl-phosphate beta-glucosyltransferase